jgi:hypothetical protein
MSRNTLIAVVLGLSAAMSTAHAATFPVDFNIGADTVIGIIGTDGFNAGLSSTDFTSWTFFLDGGNEISSSDPAAAVVQINYPVIGSNGSNLYFSPGGLIGGIQIFEDSASCGLSCSYLEFAGESNDPTNWRITYSTPTTTATDLVPGLPDLYDVPLPPGPPTTPVPTSLPLFASGLAALGLLGWRKRRSRS